MKHKEMIISKEKRNVTAKILELLHIPHVSQHSSFRDHVLR